MLTTKDIEGKLKKKTIKTNIYKGAQPKKFTKHIWGHNISN